MSCSVNLIPVERLHAQVRDRRRAAWLAACAIIGVLVGAGWIIERAGANALARLSGTVSALQVQRGGIRERLAAGQARRTELLARLQKVAAARQPQTWAARLTAMTGKAPEGVFLTGLNVSEIVSTEKGNAPQSPRPAATPAAPGAATAKPQSSESTAPAYTVRLLGYAIDHAALIQFINTLQSLPGWRRVELVRATLEPYRGGVAVAFELEGQTQEGTP